MTHMRPVAEHMVMYHIETNCGTEMVPESVCGHIGLDMYLDDVYEQVGEYLEGNTICGFERAEGWYGRLSAPGYLDCTDWMGDYPTEAEALTAVKDFYEVDDNGDDTMEQVEELNKGDRIQVCASPSGIGYEGLTYASFSGVLQDDAGTSEGWDVVDVLTDDGNEVSIYCFSIER